MAFPTLPVDGQTYVTSAGIIYKYIALTKVWYVNYQPISKDNVIAIANPSSTDDINSGYVIGSTWYNSVSGEVFINTSNVGNAATWKSLGDHDSTAIVDPAVTDDANSGFSIGSLWYNSTTTVTFMCTVATVGSAVWVSLVPSAVYTYAHIPILTSVPLVNTPITFTSPILQGIANTGSIFTVVSAGLYDINYTAYSSGGQNFRIYYAVVYINGVVDPVNGWVATLSNQAATGHEANLVISKTKQLNAGDTIEFHHLVDNSATTIGADMRIMRIA
jgi:hypothetical protein